MSKVFISHSTRGDSYATAVRLQLVSALRERGYDVLVDVDGLLPGDTWHPRLYEWLLECRAAVVLLNRSALASRWVHREVDILMWRHHFNPSFLVLPAPIGDVVTKDMKLAGFGELTSLQLARRVAAENASRDPADAVEAIVRAFPPLPSQPDDDDPVQGWAEDITAQLSQVRTMSRLARMGRALGLEDRHSAGGPVSDVSCGFLAAQMLHTHDALRLRDAVAEVARHMDRTALDQLVQLVLPVWIDAASARRVLPAGERDRPRTVVLGVRSPDTGEYYLGRAFCMDYSRYCPIVVSAPSPGEEDPAEELQYRCERTIRARFGMTDREPLSSAARLPDCDTYVVIFAEHCSLEETERVIDWLHGQLPWLHILLIPRDELTDGDPRPGLLAEASLLIPPFGADDERIAIRVAYGMLTDWGHGRGGDDGRAGRTSGRG
ncbi:toll/interleukin-1 receptor domain-containing protein [Streptomyces sp. NPDC002680]|uniref:toll/interleukin-1 receptor domain-containing protein n=1 Tax=Streptomyces sp. NPDC002680 TaxID=3364659 RepID=UPI003691AA16